MSEKNKEIFDLAAYAASDQFDFEFKSRRKEHPEDANLRRRKEWWFFLIIILAITTSLLACVVYLFLNPASEYSGTALNGVVGITIALIGYYAGAKHKD